MTSQEGPVKQGQHARSPLEQAKVPGQHPIPGERRVKGEPPHGKYIAELARRPRRNPVLHWGAFVLSLVSLGFLVAWLVLGRGAVPPAWSMIDIVLGAMFVFEFFSRSGFRWNPVGYTLTRFFDFVAIVPALALANHGFFAEGVWIWVVLAARVVRVVDRILGDGFVRRNSLVLVEGLEEEITDRVLLHIMHRIETDLARGHFGEAIAGVLEKNKSDVLERIGQEHPFEGIGGGFAHLIGIGLDVFLRRTEEHVFEAIVNVLKSPEMDKTIREGVNSVFSTMREEITKRTWHQRFGLGEDHLWESQGKPPAYDGTEQN